MQNVTLKSLRCLLLAPLLVATASANILVTDFGNDLMADELDGSWFGNYDALTSTVTANTSVGSGITQFTPIGNIGDPGTTTIQVQLTASLDVNPGTNFVIFFYDDSVPVQPGAFANFSWSDFGATPTVSTANFVATGGFNFDNVTGWQLSVDGLGNPITVTFDELVIITNVPEPATSGLLLGALGLAALRRRACK